MRGTAAAASSLLTVTRTRSLPASASAAACAAVASTSAVSVLVIAWTTIGWRLPTCTGPTWTVAVGRRRGAGMPEIYPTAGTGNGQRSMEEDGIPQRRSAGVVPRQLPLIFDCRRSALFPSLNPRLVDPPPLFGRQLQVRRTRRVAGVLGGPRPRNGEHGRALGQHPGDHHGVGAGAVARREPLQHRVGRELLVESPAAQGAVGEEADVPRSAVAHHGLQSLPGEGIEAVLDGGDRNDRFRGLNLGDGDV